jgi:hypothetical protein
LLNTLKLKWRKAKVSLQIWWYRKRGVFVQLNGENYNEFYIEIEKGDLFGFTLDDDSTNTLFKTLTEKNHEPIEFELMGMQVVIPAWAVERMRGPFAQQMKKALDAAKEKETKPN